MSRVTFAGGMLALFTGCAPKSVQFETSELPPAADAEEAAPFPQPSRRQLPPSSRQVEKLCLDFFFALSAGDPELISATLSEDATIGQAMGSDRSAAEALLKLRAQLENKSDSASSPALFSGVKILAIGDSTPAHTWVDAHLTSPQELEGRWRLALSSENSALKIVEIVVPPRK